MLRLKVRLHGGLERETANSDYAPIALPPGATLSGLQDALRIPRGEVGLFVVNGELRHEDYAPPDGAMIDIYPLFGGG